MTMLTGKVIDGQIVVKGGPLPEGATATILVDETDDVFELTPDMDAELEESIGEIRRGEFVTWPELREQLRRRKSERPPR